MFWFLKRKTTKNSNLKENLPKEFQIFFKDIPNILKWSEEIILEYFKRCVKIDLIESENIYNNSFSSKFWWSPYIYDETDYPKDEKWIPMFLLAQINILDLPKNFSSYFNKKWIIQFFISWWSNTYWCDFLDWWQNNFKVIFIEDKKIKNNNYNNYEEKILKIKEHYKQLNTPFNEKFCKKIIFKDYYTLPSWRSDETNLLCERISDVLDKDFDDIIWTYVEYSDKIFWKFNKHQMFGEPKLLQMIDDYKWKHLLLQIDSQKKEWENNNREILIWDCGIMHFSIKEDDLKNLNFNNVEYDWECH